MAAAAKAFETLLKKQYDYYYRLKRASTTIQQVIDGGLTFNEVKYRIDTLERTWASWCSTHEQLLTTIPSDSEDKYFIEDHFALGETYYFKARGAYEDILEKYKPKTESNEASKTQIQSTITGRRLPTLSVPKFSGDYNEWTNFRDMFHATIAIDKNLSQVEKLQYLRNYTQGKAAALIQNIPLSGQNFTLAWETLVKQYENKRLLKKAQFELIYALQKVQSESASALEKILHTMLQTTGALKALGCPIESWDDWLVHHIERLLDPTSVRDWRITLGVSTESPTFETLQDFLRGRILALGGNLTPSTNISQKPKGNKTNIVRSSGPKSHNVTTKQQNCYCCAEQHYVAYCPTYKALTVTERRKIVDSKTLCPNCLGKHRLTDCRSNKRCQVCNQQHHSSLHSSQQSTASPNASESTVKAEPTSPGTGSTSVMHVSASKSDVIDEDPALLATARVHVSSLTRRTLEIRALLDQGSQVSLISESLAQQLRLQRSHAPLPVYGLGGHHAVTTRGLVTIQFSSRFHDNYSCSVNAYVIPRLSEYVPDCQVQLGDYPHLQGLPLADPQFDRPGRIDILFGAKVYGHILRSGVKAGGPDAPIAQHTALGWVLSGAVPSLKSHISPTTSSLQCTVESDCHELLQRFWHQEEAPSPSAKLTADELACEEHFDNTVRRDTEGRYIVRLPFKDSTPEPGDSKTSALRMFTRLERKLSTNEALRTAYIAFMKEYMVLGHMSVVPELEEATVSEPCYYLPHHSVFKETSTTTKLRVVFNASHNTDRGISLNDCLHTGPKLQIELVDVITRWRRHQIVFSADIEKMYRQICVDSKDVDFQRILWRETPNESIQSYRLHTVTYGVASAPYLALRTLRQLALDDGSQYPLGAEIINYDIYVDDVLSGANDVDQALEKKRQIMSLLKAGGFALRKWTSNSDEVLATIPPEHREKATSLQFQDDPAFRMLGLTWEPHSDSFMFQIRISSDIATPTKRSVLSHIAQLFDPLGWLAPVIITAKIFMQSLWLLGIGWDDPLPSDSNGIWQQYYSQLEELASISVPRWLGLQSDKPTFELHGFADASERAYAAVVYLRIIRDLDDTPVTLVAAKTKVAPLKKVTIPRLELCAALLLARLISHVRLVLQCPQTPIYLWSDSTVTLCWIRGHPSRWKTYVANRISEIHTLVPEAHWRHVPGASNPADCASRGITPSELQDHSLWWTGPAWLSRPSVYWPANDLSSDSIVTVTDLEERVVTHIATAHTEQSWDLTPRFSSLSRLNRITAWCSRYMQILRARIQRKAAPLQIRTQKTTPEALTPTEINAARLFWVKKTQQTYFASEIEAVEAHRGLPPKSSLLRLTPFIDRDGLLRVGGRLKHSILDADERHPMIIPRDSPLTTLILDYSHRTVLHGGVQLTLSHIRRSYWIPHGRVRVRSHILRCIQCLRQRAATSTQLMGQLPAARTTPSRPFTHTGVDYAGPIQMRTTKGRGYKSYKGYIVVFVCFATRAIHLEAVSDYTADGFIAAFKRFTSRRGICTTLTSDCGTNLIGADVQLRKMLQDASKEMNSIINLLATDGTEWKFNPPSAPHFGGIWEAGVKSVKHHLRRVIGETTLTFEEMTTFLAQVEACLNSRPLQPMSEDPDDLSALTPGHFLIGSAITTVPEPSLQDVNVNRLTRWQLTRQMYEHFWQRWSSEYLQQLQDRKKWQQPQNPIQIGDLALLKDERLPPTKWALARVIEIYPGSDNQVRVVKVRTQDSTFTRPIVKLCLLPRYESAAVAP